MSLGLYTLSHKDSAGNFVLHISYSLLKAMRTIWIDQSFSYLTNTKLLLVRPISIKQFLNYCSVREVNINRLMLFVYFFVLFTCILNNKRVGKLLVRIKY